jgi:hypothetical protein
MNVVAEPVTLSPATQRAFERLGADLSRVFGGRFVALVASSPASSVAFVRAIGPGDLHALATLAPSWHRDRLDTPLVVTPEEFQRSLDVFPIEYQAILDRHTLVSGIDPFGGARANADDLRRACEVQAKSHLLHLRQGWIDAHGDDEDLADLLVRSAAPLRALLASLARLSANGQPVSALDGARAAGLDAETVALLAAVVGLEADVDAAAPLTARLGDYLSASEQLWTFVDGWRAR